MQVSSATVHGPTGSKTTKSASAPATSAPLRPFKPASLRPADSCGDLFLPLLKSIPRPPLLSTSPQRKSRWQFRPGQDPIVPHSRPFISGGHGGVVRRQPGRQSRLNAATELAIGCVADGRGAHLIRSRHSGISSAATKVLEMSHGDRYPASRASARSGQAFALARWTCECAFENSSAKTNEQCDCFDLRCFGPCADRWTIAQSAPAAWSDAVRFTGPATSAWASNGSPSPAVTCRGRPAGRLLTPASCRCRSE